MDKHLTAVYWDDERYCDRGVQLYVKPDDAHILVFEKLQENASPSEIGEIGIDIPDDRLRTYLTDPPADIAHRGMMTSAELEAIRTWLWDSCGYSISTVDMRMTDEAIRSFLLGSVRSLDEQFMVELNARWAARQAP
jgi:hypothetical protein